MLTNNNLPAAGEHFEFMEVLGELTNGHHAGPDTALDELEEWQSRPLDAVYPTVVIDTLTVKTREGSIAVRPVYVVIGLDCEGHRDVLGMWIGEESGESKEFWLTMLGELKARGVADVCVVCCDDATSLPEAIGQVWPRAAVQLSVVRLLRACVHYATSKDSTPMAQSMRAVCSAPDEEAAALGVQAFGERWQSRYPAAVRLWQARWADIAALWKFPPEVRRVISTTNQIESVNAALRKVIRLHGYFLSMQAALSALHQTLRGLREDGRHHAGAQVPRWKSALQAFTIHFEGRLPTP